MSEQEIVKNKKLAENDWSAKLPYTKFAKNKFYKVVPPLILGIELIELPKQDAYRPHFVIYPLWQNSVKSCLQTPILVSEFKYDNGMQITIPFSRHDKYFEDASSLVVGFLTKLKGNDILIEDIFSLMTKHLEVPPIAASPGSYLQAKLYESMLNVAIFLNSSTYIEFVLGKVNKIKWDENHFELWGVEVSEWLGGLKQKLKDYHFFIDLITKNLKDEKLAKLSKASLV